MRPYTGNNPKSVSNGQGIERLVKLTVARWGAVCLGTFANRDKRGKPGNKSVHAFYRAADIRFLTDADRNEAFEWFTSSKVANKLRIEMVCDYAYSKRDKLGRPAYGRMWMCNDDQVHRLTKGAVEGGGQKWANWLHIEIAPGALANNGAKFEEAWRSLPKP